MSLTVAVVEGELVFRGAIGMCEEVLA
eukprot:COSAG02_NODE_64493_length_260_cov_0.844720_2_plen_26_part_01